MFVFGLVFGLVTLVGRPYLLTTLLRIDGRDENAAVEFQRVRGKCEKKTNMASPGQQKEPKRQQQ